MQTRETSTSSARVTGRSLLLGVLFIPVNVYWMTLVEVKYYSLDGSCLPLFIQPVFILFVCVMANTVLKRLAPRQMLRQGELLTVYIMVAISCTFAGHDTMQNMFGSIAHAFRFATDENEWQALFFRYLPSWLTISDTQSLQGFYEGEATFYTKHNFSVWAKPLAFWGLFFLIMMFMMLCINTLVRKRWAEQEKLAYPIIQLPLRLSEDGGILLLKNRMMWVGFSIAVFIGVINGIHYLFPQFPEIPYIKRTAVFQNIFTDRPWNVIRGTRISVYPFAVGLAFFLPLDLSFSCWFFFVVRLAEFVIGAALGTRYFPALNEQAYGAWIALFLLAVWVTRRHLTEVLKKVLGFKSSLDDSNEPMPYRAAALGVLGSLVALGIFASLAGMALWVAGVFFGVYFLLSFAITRVRAELGTPHEIYYVNPHDMLATVGGTRQFDTSSLTIMSLFYWFNRGYRNHPMPNQIEAFKLAESTGMGNRRLWMAMLIAIIVGILVTFWANLDITFRNGAVAKAGGFKGWVGRESFSRLQRWLHNPTEPNMIGIGFMGIGALLTFVMMYMRMHFLWWPFHPAGYALAISFAMDYFWFAFFVAWFLKLMILRHGGLRLHRKVAPLFLGLILGDYVIGSIWAIIGPRIRLADLQDFHLRLKPMNLPVGKLKHDFLKQLLPKHNTSPELVVGPKIGEDAAVIELGDHYLVATSDPITFATEDIGWYVVCVNSNDIAAMGAVPKWLLVTLLLPEDATTPERVRDIMAQLTHACTAFDIALCGGHTEVTPAVTQPVVIGQMMGVTHKGALFTSADACVGDALILTKGLGIEATAIIARECEEELRGKCDAQFLEQAKNYLTHPGISVLKDAQIAIATGGVHAMHDVTEGGVSTAVHELATAAELGAVVYSDKLLGSPVLYRDITRTLCDMFGLNPLGLISSGAMLIAAEFGQGETICRALNKAGISAAIIGKFLPPADGLWLEDATGTQQPLPVFETDEIAKLFSSGPL